MKKNETQKLKEEIEKDLERIKDRMEEEMKTVLMIRAGGAVLGIFCYSLIWANYGFKTAALLFLLLVANNLATYNK